ncbi:DUF3471 domain-containing protein [Lacinutrix neustonica]|uniref:DUF3471 domain-containing protein n=1 Tax=Lacinutrix neustonica TaxID=2980107 RepID=A0A9E8MX96_9FLAO|nr:DUF3471 domain-containing protein [Lacinutrix neustonica]WAC02247.1 DUF3471 domain-containing protein [Lacinutrix neustonica]
MGESIKDVEVPVALLKSYEGKYELAPTFHIVITEKEGRLFAQATAQPQFELFPSAVNQFYFKIVKANVVFNANSKGKIESLTLFQNGQVVPGKKME